MSTQPGTYTGKDGREYRWQLTAKGNYTNLDEQGYGGVIPPADWPAAKAALDALVEQEGAEWVEIDPPYVSMRIKRDGTHPQERGHCTHYEDGKPVSTTYHAWDDSAYAEDWALAYRKGRSVAQQESADLRDAARELVEAVGRKEPLVVLRDELPDDSPVWGWVVRMQAAAKALEGKL